MRRAWSHRARFLDPDSRVEGLHDSFSNLFSKLVVVSFSGENISTNDFKKKKEALRVTQTLTCFSKISGHK